MKGLQLISVSTGGREEGRTNPLHYLANSIVLTYYDKLTSKNRLKRRYLYGGVAFLFGLGCGLMTAHLV